MYFILFHKGVQRAHGFTQYGAPSLRLLSRISLPDGWLLIDLSDHLLDLVDRNCKPDVLGVLNDGQVDTQ